MSDKLGPAHERCSCRSVGAPAPRLLDQLRDGVRLKHYSLRTERASAQWVKRYIYFHGRRHLAGLGAAVRRASGPPCPASAICCRRRRT
ncbi:phage integrase N-terminal SAM-like domain-containing protein [Immundisolibacter sp.]|uniref:phage integrase N-terminal SAM-like domain-containing protein n=1 Tax=Immundisolibacter sp. TaxID=1934948 RepID=UPI00342E9703